MTMERKIGEIFENNGEWYQCVENSVAWCASCDFRKKDCKTLPLGPCDAIRRSDKRCAIFRKLEKVGEPVLYGLRMSQKYKVSIPVELSKDPSAPWMSYNLIDNLLYIEVKQQNPNTGDMETKEKTMPVPDGWEFDHLDERGNIVLKEKKKELPKTWLECLHVINDIEYIQSADSQTSEYKVFGEENEVIRSIDEDKDRNLLPLGLGKPMLALCQLLVCRNAWWKQLGWKPDWNSENEKYIDNYYAFAFFSIDG